MKNNSNGRTQEALFVLNYQGHGNWNMSDPFVNTEQVLEYIATGIGSQYEVVRKVNIRLEVE